MQITGNQHREVTVKQDKVNISEEKCDDVNSPAVDSVQMNSNDDVQSEEPKQWTILHYGAADNNLKNYLVSDLNEMEMIGSNENMNVISMLDVGGDDCKVYYIEQDDDMKQINSPVIENKGNTDMADPAVLSEFIRNMTEKYPAENYALILADHGEGWKGGLQDETPLDISELSELQTVLERKDITKNQMTLPQMREAMDNSGVKLDILGFDACLMATGEVAYELQDNADYLVASQALEGAKGWPYTPLLTSDNLEFLQESLDHRIDLSPADFAEKMIDNAMNDPRSLPTLSLTDLDNETMDKYAQAVDKFSDALLETDTDNYTLRLIRGQAEKYSDINNSLRDQAHFCQLVIDSKKITDENLKSTAEELIDVITKDVIIKNHKASRKKASGISAEIPGVQGTPPEYQDLRFAQETKWDEAVNKFMKN
jgi:hypothetical protein